MAGLAADGKPLRKGEAPDDWFFLHHIFRLTGNPPHVVEHWEPGQKKAAFISIALQLEEENKRMAGRMM